MRPDDDEPELQEAYDNGYNDGWRENKNVLKGLLQKKEVECDELYEVFEKFANKVLLTHIFGKEHPREDKIWALKKHFPDIFTEEILEELFSVSGEEDIY